MKYKRTQKIRNENRAKIGVQKGRGGGLGQTPFVS